MKKLRCNMDTDALQSMLIAGHFFDGSMVQEFGEMTGRIARVGGVR